MNLSCQTDDYAGLYTRWLENPGRLLNLARWRPGETLLDLCGGSGAVTLEARIRGAEWEDIALLDLNPRCMAPVQKHEGEAEELLLWIEDQYDVIVCRQAIGYLNIKYLGETLYKLLKPGGRFVFNSFVRPRWSLKPYKFGGRWFLEASGYIGHRVGHLQWTREFGPDVTVFRWHTEEELDRAFRPHFDNTTIERTAKSLRWVCTRNA